jgi:hypothetical protein
MSSDRKITANRNNAKKSTGPRSKAGREASRRNARRHGLAIDIGADPAFHEDIEQLATVLSLSSGAQKVSEHARQAAEAELDLTRIRKIRAPNRIILLSPGISGFPGKRNKSLRRNAKMRSRARS